MMSADNKKNLKNFRRRMIRNFGSGVRIQVNYHGAFAYSAIAFVDEPTGARRVADVNL